MIDWAALFTKALEMWVTASLAYVIYVATNVWGRNLREKNPSRNRRKAAGHVTLTLLGFAAVACLAGMTLGEALKVGPQRSRSWQPEAHAPAPRGGAEHSWILALAASPFVASGFYRGYWKRNHT